MSQKENTSQNFEKALGDLEHIVTELESDDLALDKSLELFEKGIALSRVCTKKLSEAEIKVESLLKELSKSMEKDVGSHGSDDITP